MARRRSNRSAGHTGGRQQQPPADYDGPWKEALDGYFEAFIAFLFPLAHADIDWSRPPEMLDKELQKILRSAKHGRRVVDKLVKVWLKDGTEQWLLIHIEIQTWKEGDFPRRMYVYNYRLFDRYDREVISLAVLADDDPDWRPNHFGYSRWGFQTGTTFPAPKLLDYAPQWQALEVDPNPFATVVLAHLKALETRGNPVDRHAWKLRLVKGLYERGIEKEDVRRLFRFIDWLMELPPELERHFEEEVAQYEEDKHMPYVTSWERRARRESLLKGIKAILGVKFEEAGLALLPEIESLEEVDTLEAVLEEITRAQSPEDVRAVWTEEDVAQDEVEKHRPYVTAWERRVRREELLAGIKSSLKIKFKEAGLALLPEIESLEEVDLLKAILEAIDSADSPEDVRAIWRPEEPDQATPES